MVRSVTPRASAISVSVISAKYRISTTCTLRGSRRASVFMASSSATRSAARSPPTTAAFQIVAPRIFHQNAPHQLGRNGEEMGSILPLHALIIHEAHVGFVDQGGSLQAVAGALVFHVAARQAAKLVIDDGGQPVEGALVATAPGAEKRAYVAHSRLTRLCRPLHRLRIIPPRPVSSNYSSPA